MGFLIINTVKGLIFSIFLMLVLLSSVTQANAKNNPKHNKYYKQAEAYCNDFSRRYPQTQCIVVRAGTSCPSNANRGRRYGSKKNVFYTCLTAPIDKNNRYYRQIETWCKHYLQRNPRMRCEIISNVKRCPSGLYNGQQYPSAGLEALKGFRACVNGSRDSLEAPDYVLQCRSGGDMSAILDRTPTNSAVKIYNIRKSRYGAGNRKPGLGECAWLDRPLSSREPNRLLYKIKARKTTFSKVTISKRGIELTWGNDPIVNFLKNLKSGQLYYFHVKNNHQGWLEIIRLGP